MYLFFTNPFFCNFISWAFAFQRYGFWSLVSQVKGSPIITGQFANILIRRINSTTLRNAAWSRQSIFTRKTTGELSFPEKSLKIITLTLMLSQNSIDIPFLLLYRHFVRRGPLAKYPGLQIWAQVA